MECCIIAVSTFAVPRSACGSQGGQHVVSYLLHAGYPAGAAESEVEPGEAQAEEVPQLAGHLRGPAGDRIWLRLGIWIDADAEVEDAADVVWPSACGLGRCIYPVPHGGDLFGRHVQWREGRAAGPC